MPRRNWNWCFRNYRVQASLSSSMSREMEGLLSRPVPSLSVPCVVAFLATHASRCECVPCMPLTVCVPARNSRVPLDDDFEVCDEPPPEPEHQLSAPTTIYFAGPVGMGFMSYIPPDAVMTEWTTIIRPYSPRPPRGSTRIERGNQSMADRFGEFAFSALNGLFGSPPPEPPSTGIRFTEAEQRAMSHYIAWHA